jgi:hypothetical protein
VADPKYSDRDPDSPIKLQKIYIIKFGFDTCDFEGTGQYHLAEGSFLYLFWGILIISAWVNRKKVRLNLDPNPEDFFGMDPAGSLTRISNIIHNTSKNKLCGNAGSCF